MAYEDVEINVGFNVNFEDLEKELTELQNKINLTRIGDLGKDELKALGREVVNAQEKLKAFAEANRQALSSSQIEELRHNYATLKADLQSIATVNLSNNFKEAETATEGLTKQLTDLNLQYERAKADNDKMGVNNTLHQLEQLRSKINEVRATLATTEGTDVISPSRIANLTNSLDTVESKMFQTTTRVSNEFAKMTKQTDTELQSNIQKGTTSSLISFGKIRRIWMQGIKNFFNNIQKYTNMWLNLLGSGLKTVSSGFKSLLSTMFSSTKSSLGGIISEFKGLIGIAGGLGLTKLGSEAISTANEFKNLGSTSQIVARQMSNAFYEAAGDSYNSLVSLSNGTNKVTNTLQKFINTWTGQVALMKAQLTSIGANIGNLLIKVFYPLLQVLNKVLAVVNLLVSKLAALFGFNTAKLGDILGNVGGQSASQNKGLESYSKAADKAAKSTKKLSDNTKKARENLQGYDKLNNTTTDDLEDLSDALDEGLGSDVGGILDTDALFDNLMDKLDLIPDWLKKWIDELMRLVENGEWYNVGKHIGDLVNKGLYSLEKFLSDENLTKKLHAFNDALLELVNGVLDTVDWKVLGKNMALALNLIAFEINDLYETAVKKGTLKKTGKAIHDTVVGFFENLDAYEIGKAFTTKIRTIIDIIYETLDNLTAEESELIARKIFNFFDGAFDRLLGMNDGDLKSGAQKIGEIIGKVINLGLETVSKLANAETAKKTAEGIVSIINAGINAIDETQLTNALSGVMQFIGTLLYKLADEINTDDFVNKITGAINESAENGSLSTLVGGITKFINNFFETIKKIIKGLDWGTIWQAVRDGLEEDGDSLLANFFEFVVAPSLLVALAKGLVAAGEWALIGAALKGGLGAAIGAAAPVIAGGLLGIVGIFGEIKDGLDTANAAATIFGTTLAGFAIGGPIGGVIGALAGAIVSFGIAWSQNSEEWKQELDEMGQKASLIIPTIVDHLTFLKNRAGILIGEAATDIKNLWTDMWTNVANKVIEAKTSIDNKIQTIKQGLSNAFNNLVKSAVTWGKNLITGLINGIVSGLSSLWSTVNNICSNIQTRFRNAMKIHSPSRVMEDLGIFIPEGIALGIEDGEGYVNSAVDDIANSIKFSDFYKSAYDETDAFVDDVSARLQDINTPILDPLKYQANITSNPATTARTLAQSYSDTASQRNDGVLAGIYNRMISAGQASGKNVVVDVYLDKNNRLGQYIIDTMRGDVVMTGGV